MRFFSVFLLICLASEAFAQVENWGGPVERVDEFLGMGFTCQDADRAEVEYIDCQIPTLAVVEIEKQKNFDRLSEELIFMEAARRNSQFVSCQRKLFDGLKDQEQRNTLKENAYLQFKHIERALGRSLKDQKAAEETVDVFRPANFAEDRFNHRYNEWREERKAKAQGVLSEINSEITNLLARVPLANRKNVKEKLIEVLQTKPNISKTDFFSVYEELLNTLDSQITQSVSFFDGIKTPQPDGTSLFSVDDDLKLRLVRTGQVSNVISSLDMETRLARSFVCRTRARYETGPRSRQALELPLYFAGAYGLGRLAVRAAATGAKAISTAARAGMIGLDVLEGARGINETLAACFPDEFLSGSLEESCTMESEISSVYQEADIASCATTGVLNLAPVAFVGGVRIWARRADAVAAPVVPRTEPRVEPVTSPATPANVIVVTARRRRVTARAKREDPVAAPETPAPALVRSEGELPRVSSNKINLSVDKIKRLRFAPRNPEIVRKHITDPDFKKGIGEAFEKMNDPEEVAKYISELQEDTFRVMLGSSDSKLKSMARWGKIDRETMLNVLKSRVESRGANIVKIEQAEGTLTEQAFNARIGQGYLIDHGFPEGMSHGTYTHLFQQDMAYDIISRSSGKSHQQIIEFFGTPEGMKVWDRMFDASPRLNSPHSPEYFRKNIMENNVPLGFMPNKKKQVFDRSLIPA